MDLGLIKGDISSDEARELILRKGRNTLNKWQASEALHHWSCKFALLPIRPLSLLNVLGSDERSLDGFLLGDVLEI